MAHPKHQSVRERFAFRCGYCGVSETDTGGELTIDHFQPVWAGGDDSSENLVYACNRCNQYKGAILPVITDFTHKQRLLHPLRDSFDEHIQVDEITGNLVGRTSTGTFHIEALRLNRAALIAHRHRRHLNALQDARLEQILSENVLLRERLTRYEAYKKALEKRKY